MSPVEIEIDDEQFVLQLNATVLGPVGFRAWFQEFARIRTKGGDIEAPVLNKLQERVCDVVEWALSTGTPLRLVILKPRQKGASTISVAIVYYFMCRFGSNGIVIGGLLFQTDNMWEILKRYSSLDEFDWGFAREINEVKARFGNGAGMQKHTARTPEAARSDTIQVCLATETGRWKKLKAAPPEKVIGGILKGIPNIPHSAVIFDSTAGGPVGFYYNKWEGAVYLSERQAGEEGNGWIKVFAGWHEFPDSRLPVDRDMTPSEAAQLIDSYTEKEKRLVMELGLVPEQVNWRRKTIIDECDGDEREFDEDFPGTPQDAFRASSPSRFNSTALHLIAKEAMLSPNTPTYGVFNQPDPKADRFVLERCEPTDHHEVLIFDEPVPGCRYILPVDTMTGEFADGANLKSRDHHSALVLRDGFWDSSGRWHPVKVVARTPHSCQWDIDILTDVVFALASHYGDCMIVPEENQDRGLIGNLRKKGATLYQRKIVDERNDTTEASSVKSKRYGYKTVSQGEGAKKKIIARLARAIRMFDAEGEGIDIPDIQIVRQLENFIVHPDGSEGATTGAHDDDVMALAIGHETIQAATVYMPKDRLRITPPDILRLERESRASGGRKQYS